MIEKAALRKPVPTIHNMKVDAGSGANKPGRINSIDFLRGIIMIIMALDHTRDYFHNDAFLYSPTDLSQTSVFLFFTRWVTHYCAPIFIFLAGISAYLYGMKRTKKELCFFLFTRGLWLVFIELFILSLERTFNPSYSIFSLQVIFAIGVCMIVLSVLIYMNEISVLVISILLIGAHNLLDNVHIPGKGIESFSWALLHEPGNFEFGGHNFFVTYPLIPWIGVMAFGYCLGSLYSHGTEHTRRKKILLSLGISAIVLFIILRSGNWYGDPAVWSQQKNNVFSFLSFLNVTKYPPSLLYVLVMLGPAFIFLALSEKPLTSLAKKITVFGRVAMFYYLAHIFLIHLLALPATVISGYKLSDMILTTRVNSSPELKGYGFDLGIVFIIWIAVILILYPFCKWFDRYKRLNGHRYRWLSYL